jgi:hypothetical protein
MCRVRFVLPLRIRSAKDLHSAVVPAHGMRNEITSGSEGCEDLIQKKEGSKGKER